MDLSWIKYHRCPEDEEEGVLLVDVETETVPETDEEGNKQYYCLEGGHIFSVDEDGGSKRGGRRR